MRFLYLFTRVISECPDIQIMTVFGMFRYKASIKSGMIPRILALYCGSLSSTPRHIRILSASLKYSCGDEMIRPTQLLGSRVTWFIRKLSINPEAQLAYQSSVAVFRLLSRQQRQGDRGVPEQGSLLSGLSVRRGGRNIGILVGI